MAQVVQLTILQKNQYALSEGQIWVVPVNAFVAKPYTGTVNGVTANSLIEVFPTGLNQPTVKLLCAETITEIANAANA